MGDVADDTREREGERDGDDVEADKLVISLEHTRWRHFGWAVFGAIGGALLLWKMGTVAQWLGVGLIGLGVWSTYHFVRTLLFDAGTIVVDGGRVLLPRGLCRGKSDAVDRAAIVHAYLLRRAVPWTYHSPVLMIEAGSRAYPFPRDWFASEADQRRVIHALARAVQAEARTQDQA